jgi:hypothetical protein
MGGGSEKRVEPLKIRINTRGKTSTGGAVGGGRGGKRDKADSDSEEETKGACQMIVPKHACCVYSQF